MRCAGQEVTLRTCNSCSDGEAVIRNVYGISDFNALHSGKHNDEVPL
jgi:hypothetical protein